MKVKRTVKLRAYEVILRAVEEGTRCGYRRAHKHTDKPGEDLICEQVEREVMSAICEVLDPGDL